MMKDIEYTFICPSCKEEIKVILTKKEIKRIWKFSKGKT